MKMAYISRTKDVYTGPDIYEVAEDDGDMKAGFYWQMFEESVPKGEPYGPFETEDAARYALDRDLDNRTLK
jgi:hypothetical protein